MREDISPAELARAINNRVPTLRCVNGACLDRGGNIIIPVELAKRLLRVLDGDETAACKS